MTAMPFSQLVITPTLGTSPWLEETIASVAALPIKCTHVLVAPGGMVSLLKQKFPQTRVVPESGGNMYSAINAGLTATHDWDAFTYINDDDLILPAFAGAVALMAKNRNRIFFVYGQVRLIDGKGRRLGGIPVSPWPRINRDLYAQRLEPVYQHGALVSRAAWEQVGGFDPAFRYCGDSEFFARLCVRGVPAVRVAGEVAAFRLRSGQLTKNRTAMLEERIRVDRKLALLTPHRTLRHHWARLVFRAANLSVYAERIVRHGFMTFDDLLERRG